MGRPRKEDDSGGLTDIGLPRNFIRPCILLLLKEGDNYGYDLLMRLRPFGFHRGDPGALYRTLRAMQHDGLIRSWWVGSQQGPPRRNYVLTEEGEDWLHAWAGAMREGVRFLSRWTKRYNATFDQRRSEQHD